MQSKSTYQNGQTWQKVREFLPRENRLNEKEMPLEERVEMGDTSIHIDHYVPQKAKAVVIILHGVGGNGRLPRWVASLHSWMEPPR